MSPSNSSSVLSHSCSLGDSEEEISCDAFVREATSDKGVRRVSEREREGGGERERESE